VKATTAALALTISAACAPTIGYAQGNSTGDLALATAPYIQHAVACNKDWQSRYAETVDAVRARWAEETVRQFIEMVKTYAKIGIETRRCDEGMFAFWDKTQREKLTSYRRE
jgi:hypothetical protein